MLLKPADDPVGDRRYEQICNEVAVVMGAINVGYGRLVELAQLAVAEGLASGPGILSDAHWLAWRTGMSLGRCKDVLKLAERSQELPAAVGALVAGELTLDQAAQIGRHVPAAFDQSCTQFATLATVNQLRKALPNYGFDRPARDPKGEGQRREVLTGVDRHGWWIRARLSEAEGAVMDRSLKATRDDLWRQRRADTPDGQPVKPVSMADALVAQAETALRAGEAARPGTDRYLVHLHLEEGPHGLQLAEHLGIALPDHQRRLLLCDAVCRAVVRDGVTPVGIGRKTRIVNRRLRRLIEHRDGGCVVPGCTTTVGLQIHHIRHWEDGGPTETWNLVAVCSRHHQAHHQGRIHIEGNPEAPAGSPEILTVADLRGRLLDPSGQPIPKVPHVSQRPGTTTPGEGAAEAARAAGLDPSHYRCPLGERMTPWGVHFNPNDPPPPPEAEPEPCLAGHAPNCDRPPGRNNPGRGTPPPTGPPTGDRHR